MALQKNELFSGPTSIPQQPRLKAEALMPVRFAASATAELLPLGTPVAVKKSTGKWVPYQQSADHPIFTITDQAGATDGGTFVLMVDGLASVHAWDVTPAAMQAELLALLADAGKPYTVACTCTETNLGVSAAVMTLTFSEAAGAISVDLDGSGLTDGGVAEPGNLVLAASDAGTAMDETDLIKGFVYESQIQLDDTDDVLGIVMVEGEAYAADVNTAAIRAVLGGSPSEGEVQAALKADHLRARFVIRGLVGAY